MKFEELHEFKKDLKQLLKKYRTLEDDIGIIRKVLEVEPNERPPYSFRINDLGIKTCVIKIKKIASRSLKGKGVNSGFRLVYAHFQEEKRIVFIQLYHKTNNEKEDRERIKKYFQ